MKRALRVISTFASWQELTVLALLCADATVHELYRAWVTKVFLVMLLLLGLYAFVTRIRKIAASSVWSVLPDGYRIFVRALGLTVLALAVLIGGLWRWISEDLLDVPLGPIVVVYVYLSILGVILLAGIGRRLPGFLVTLLVFAATLAVTTCFTLFSDPRVWWPIALVCAAGWILASRIELPFLRHGPVRRRQGVITRASGMLFAGVRNWLLLLNSPARTILQSQRSGLGNLMTAVLVSIGWALFVHLLFGYRFPVDTYRVVIGPNSEILAMTGFFMAYGMAARMRALWLRCGDSRAALFRMAERCLLLNLVALSLVTWSAVTGLALLRDLPIGRSAALAALLSYAACTLAPLYLGLWLVTMHRWWQRILAAIFGVALIGTSPSLWRMALGGDLPFAPNRAKVLIALLAMCLVLRAMASWRWRTIDWARFRPSPKAQRLRSSA